MKPVLIGNLFRKQHELLHQLSAIVQNMLKIRPPSLYEEQMKRYKEAIETIVNFSAVVDQAFMLDTSSGKLAEMYHEADEIWKIVLENRKIMEDAVGALKELKYNSEMLANVATTTKTAEDKGGLVLSKD